MTQLNRRKLIDRAAAGTASSNPASPSSWFRRDALSLLVGAAFAPAFVPFAARGAEGPVTLIITYRASPANRLAFLNEMAWDVAGRLQRAQAEGQLTGFRLLTSRYVESRDWDAMALLSFTGPRQSQKWRAVEDTAPAALGPRALELVSAVETAPVDLIRKGGAPGGPDTPAPVLLVIPYEYVIPVGQYVKYLDGYTVPQIEGWMREGVLTRYAMYLCRYPAGRPWNALLFLEYAGEEGLAQREETVAKVRAQLASVPSWKAWSDDKGHIRNEKEVVVADDLQLHRPG